MFVKLHRRLFFCHSGERQLAEDALAFARASLSQAQQSLGISEYMARRFEASKKANHFRESVEQALPRRKA